MEIKIKEIKIDFTKPEGAADRIQARVEAFSDNNIFLGEHLINGRRGKIGISFDAEIKANIEDAVKKIKNRINEEIIGRKKS
jgi:hypothetical protein